MSAFPFPHRTVAEVDRAFACTTCAKAIQPNKTGLCVTCLRASRKRIIRTCVDCSATIAHTAERCRPCHQRHLRSIRIEPTGRCLTCGIETDPRSIRCQACASPAKAPMDLDGMAAARACDALRDRILRLVIRTAEREGITTEQAAWLLHRGRAPVRSEPIEAAPMPSRVYAHTLGGVASGW